jgi:uncharacterized protein (TIGR02246 family)
VSAWNSIEGVLYRYSLGFDEDDIELLLDCFTEDATFDTGVVETGLRQSLDGRAAIREFLEKRRAGRAAADKQVRHVITNVLVLDERPDEALVVSYQTAVVTTGGRDAIVEVMAWIRDRMVRQDGEWRIRERSLYLDKSAPGQPVPKPEIPITAQRLSDSAPAS